MHRFGPCFRRSLSFRCAGTSPAIRAARPSMLLLMRWSITCSLMCGPDSGADCRAAKPRRPMLKSFRPSFGCPPLRCLTCSVLHSLACTLSLVLPMDMGGGLAAGPHFGAGPSCTQDQCQGSCTDQAGHQVRSPDKRS